MVNLGAGEFRGDRRFAVQRRIGAGGMGVVYEARDLDAGGLVALKTLRTLDAQALYRFKNEFRALADLHHPNLVSLGELVESDGVWFFTMELVPGLDFLDHVRNAWGGAGPVSQADTARDAVSATEVTEQPSPARRLWAGPDPGALPCDEARLRPALAQLARGLTALHAAGKVHRDVKPSNIRVTPEGRVVLLDLGLVADARSAQDSVDGFVVGTAAYMAPEQAAGHRVGPEADWYAVGAILYEALTGQPPHGSAGLTSLVDKQRFEPPPPHAMVAGVPRDLDDLCTRLLALQPGRRPNGRDVLARLGQRDDSGPAAAAWSAHAPPFVGRRAELAALAEAFAETRRGGAVAVVVEGESGVGKSALVRQFADRLVLQDPGVVVLAGRCYERESVPYKAIDEVLDALSRLLVRLPGEQAAALLPRQATLLAEVFPVLRRVKSFAAAAPLPPLLDRQEQRTRLFAAVRETLGRLADRRPLVIAIDDLQWADHDSLALLAEVLRPGDAPSLLLVATVRVADRGGGELLAGEVRRLRLGPLAPAEARQLADHLIGGVAAGDRTAAGAIAAEAGGHPLFIDELVRYAAVQGSRARRVGLDQALQARAVALPETARGLLELIAVAGRPLAQSVIAAAAGLEGSDFAAALALLRGERMVRTSGGRATDMVEPYHDRVREAVIGSLADDVRRAHHRELAVALEGSELPADAEALAAHWRGAGELGRAATWMQRAAEAAERALAFNHAAELYRSLLDVRRSLQGDAANLHTSELEVRLAGALVGAGRGAEAAAAYLRAAAGAGVADSLEYRRRAGEQLLRTGHLDAGLDVLRDVLGSLGMSLPASPRRALLSLVFNRARLRLRGDRYKLRDRSRLSPEELVRLETCWSVSASLSMVDTLLGADFQSRHNLLALAAGDPLHLARAFATEAAYLSTAGERTRRRTGELLDRALRLATELDDPAAIALARSLSSMRSYMLCELTASRDHAEAALELFRTRCTGVDWEIEASQLLALWSLYYLGEIGELCRRVPLLLERARERGDLLAETNLTMGPPGVLWLVNDDPEGARRATEAVMRRWSHRAFHLQHYWECFSRAQAYLYQGDPAEALAVVRATWDGFRRSLYLRVQSVRVEACDLRARACLAAAAGSDAGPLLDEVDALARRLGRESLPWPRAAARMLAAGTANARGQTERAIRDYTAAGDEFAAAGMALHAAVARRRLGELLGGDQGRGHVQACAAFLAGHGVRDPDRMSQMLAPAPVNLQVG